MNNHPEVGDTEAVNPQPFVHLNVLDQAGTPSRLVSFLIDSGTPLIRTSDHTINIGAMIGDFLARYRPRR